jgi:hypothetical protein
MKLDFKKAAARAGKALMKPAAPILLTGALMLAFGAVKGVDYYSSPAAHEAYKTCVAEKKPCTTDQLQMAGESVTKTNKFLSYGLVGTIVFMLGSIKLLEEHNKKKTDESNAALIAALRQFNAETQRANSAEAKLEQTAAQLAPFLAEEKRKADEAAAAAAKKELNDISEGVTTLQGDMTVTKKRITIKPAAPRTPD